MPTGKKFARQSRANGITRDGSTVYGWYTAANGQRLGAIWRDGILTPMSTADVLVGEPNGISGDGTTLVGGGAPGGQAYRWTLAGGLEAIGKLPSFGGAIAFGANYDASVVVGSSGFAFARELGSILAGGPAPFIATWLVAYAGGSPWLVACYIILLSGITAFAIWCGPETYRDDVAHDPVAEPRSVPPARAVGVMTAAE